MQVITSNTRTLDDGQIINEVQDRSGAIVRQLVGITPEGQARREAEQLLRYSADVTARYEIDKGRSQQGVKFALLTLDKNRGIINELYTSAELPDFPALIAKNEKLLEREKERLEHSKVEAEKRENDKIKYSSTERDAGWKNVGRHQNEIKRLEYEISNLKERQTLETADRREQLKIFIAQVDELLAPLRAEIGMEGKKKQ